MSEEMDLHITEPSPQLRDYSAYDPDFQISEALFNLSATDRNAIEEEIHGVSCMAPEETPDLLEDSLFTFHLELAKIDSKPAYDRAQEMIDTNPYGNPTSYIHSTCFKLQFLRCELFDACKAAKRFCKYLDLMLELHGEMVLQRPIGMADLDREEMSFIRGGTCQVLPSRDRSGRRIFCLIPNGLHNLSKRSIIRVQIYVWNSLLCYSPEYKSGNNDLSCLETQRKGTISVVIPSYQLYKNRDLEETLKLLRERIEISKLIAGVIPVRVCAVHICFPKTQLPKYLFSMFTVVISSWLSRTKFHFGNLLELRYQLQGYGIPTELIPTTDSGNVKAVNLKQWIKLRLYIESQAGQYMATLWSGESDSNHSSNNSDYESSTTSVDAHHMTDIVECPGSHDVIFRRGKSMSYHPGNVKFFNLIESRIHEHTLDPKTTQARRMAIEKELIQQIRDDGGRFLRWEIDKCWWVDMSSGTDDANDKEIRSKIHYAFRDFRKKMMKKQKVIVNTSSTYAFERQDGQKRKRYNNDANTTDDCGIAEGCLSAFHNR